MPHTVAVTSASGESVTQMLRDAFGFETRRRRLRPRSLGRQRRRRSELAALLPNRFNAISPDISEVAIVDDALKLWSVVNSTPPRCEQEFLTVLCLADNLGRASARVDYYVATPVHSDAFFVFLGLTTREWNSALSERERGVNDEVDAETSVLPRGLNRLRRRLLDNVASQHDVCPRRKRHERIVAGDVYATREQIKTSSK